MSKNLALHWELKPRKNKVLRQGPGDTLRLVHALQGLAATRRLERVDILTITPLELVRGLFHRHGVLQSNTLTEGAFRWLYVHPPSESHVAFNELLKLGADAHGLQASEYVHGIAHAYIGTRLRSPTLTMFAGERLLRERVDLAYCSSGTIAIPHSALLPVTATQTLVVFLRDESVAPKRNSPTWFVELVRDVANKISESSGKPWHIEFRGPRDTTHAKALGLDPARDCIRYFAGRSFAEQVTELSTRTAAVGVNSGGLDLAAAAGLPILRIGEFQDGGPPRESAKTRDKLNWGRRYNRFLAVATNIGLAPKVECLEDFPKHVIRKSLKNFLIQVDNLRLSRHVILPPGEALGAHVDQLDSYDTARVVPNGGTG